LTLPSDDPPSAERKAIPNSTIGEIRAMTRGMAPYDKMGK
jgi:hypothetical protein